MREVNSARQADWRRQLRRRIGWTLLLKFVALTWLWAAFFSPAHRIPVSAERVESRLVVDSAKESRRD